MRSIYSIGIDFGTANSCVAYSRYYEREGGTVDPDPSCRPQVVRIHNRDTVPTVIYAPTTPGMPPSFGAEGEERALRDPQRLFAAFKLHLGREQTGQQAFLMTKFFLTFLRQKVAERVPMDSLRPDERVETIVGHPVQWNADQREATLRAAQVAGFPNVRLEDESLAALYCHVFDHEDGFYTRPGSYILTIDMGGGTTDFAFLHIPDRVEERPVSIPVHPSTEGGPPNFGGRYLDHLLLSFMERGLSPETVQQYRRQLLQEVRRFKETFSNRLNEGGMEHEAWICYGKDRRPVRLTRDGFESIAKEYIDHFEVLVRRALQEAGLKANDITQLILTGGHSRWYWVERTLGRVFPHLYVGRQSIFRHRQPEQSVARGLAYSPLVRASGGKFLAPQRRAANPVWLQLPTGNGAISGNGSIAHEPVLLLPRGQLLPYRSQSPLRFWIEQKSSDPRETSVRLQFLTGADRTPLVDRVASFSRSFWEQVGKSVIDKLPWGAPSPLDRFEVQVELTVNEHELITADLLITRFLRGKPVDTQRQQMKLNVAAALGRSALG